MNQVLFFMNKILNKRNHRIIVDNYSIQPQLSRCDSDYVRLSTLELFARDNENISGNCAEVGVYKGDFAKYINKYMPNKKLYLFDTFEGFDNRDLMGGVDKKLPSHRVNGFKDTSVELVLSKMISANNVIIKKGYFPDTAKGIEDESFCFVSLDADLYEPTIKGLEFFYPRLVLGGIIMVHDYNGKSYKGIKKACEEFKNKFNVGYVCLGDESGSVVFVK